MKDQEFILLSKEYDHVNSCLITSGQMKQAATMEITKNSASIPAQATLQNCISDEAILGPLMDRMRRQMTGHIEKKYNLKTAVKNIHFKTTSNKKVPESPLKKA